MRIPNQSPAVKRTAGVGAPSISPSQVYGFRRAASPILSGFVQVDRIPGVAYATTDVKCGSTVYTISTGNNQGNCGTYASGGNTTNGACQDGGGNQAEVDCKWNKGEGMCTTVKGSGSCTIKSV